MISIAAYTFTILSIAIALFQVALALGAPLGDFTLGGKFSGKLPNNMRIFALVQLVILALFVILVLAKADIAFSSMRGLASIGIWVIVVFFVLGSIANISSPSKKERVVMGSANIIALISTIVVALG